VEGDGIMLSTDEKISFLKNVSSLKCLTVDQFETLAEKCEVQTYSTGEKIFSQGDEGGGLYIIVDGRVTLEREIRDQTDTISMTMVKNGAYFGEISLFHDAPRSVTALAMRETVVLLLEYEIFCSFCRNNPDLLVELNHVLCQRLVEAYDKISEITAHKKPRELQHLYDKLDF